MFPRMYLRPGFDDVLLPDDNGNVTLIAEDDCWDFDSGLSSITMMIGCVGRDLCPAAIFPRRLLAR